MKCTRGGCEGLPVRRMTRITPPWARSPPAQPGRLPRRPVRREPLPLHLHGRLHRHGRLAEQAPSCRAGGEGHRGGRRVRSRQWTKVGFAECMDESVASEREGSACLLLLRAPSAIVGARDGFWAARVQPDVGQALSPPVAALSGDVGASVAAGAVEQASRDQPVSLLSSLGCALTLRH